MAYGDISRLTVGHVVIAHVCIYISLVLNIVASVVQKIIKLYISLLEAFPAVVFTDKSLQVIIHLVQGTTKNLIISFYTLSCSQYTVQRKN